MNARQEWKQDYKELTIEIRAMKLAMKTIERKYSGTQYGRTPEMQKEFRLASSELSIIRFNLVVKRSEATGMMLDLPRIKAEGKAAWEASKKNITV